LKLGPVACFQISGMGDPNESVDNNHSFFRMALLFSACRGRVCTGGRSENGSFRTEWCRGVGRLESFDDTAFTQDRQQKINYTATAASITVQSEQSAPVGRIFTYAIVSNKRAKIRGRLRLCLTVVPARHPHIFISGP